MIQSWKSSPLARRLSRVEPVFMINSRFIRSPCSAAVLALPYIWAIIPRYYQPDGQIRWSCFMAKLINAIDPISNRTHTLTWTLLRVLSSLMYMTHGYAKLFGSNPQPFIGGMDFFGINLGVNMLWIAATIEFFGGALLVLGLFTR